MEKKRPGLVIPAFTAFGASIVAVSLLIVRNYMGGHAELAERYVRGPFVALSRLLSGVTSAVSFSLSEVAVVLLVLLAIVFIWRFLRRLLYGPYRLRYALRRLLLLVIVAALGFSLFTLMHGLNYERQALAETLQLPVEPRHADALVQTVTWLLAEARTARALLAEDADGVVIVGEKLQPLLDAAPAAYERLAAAYPELGTLVIAQPKRVLLSHWWSYTGITGMYNPLFAEANVNTDQLAVAIPFTALHELAHVAGFAREDEANFMAFLSGLHHDAPAYRYSALSRAALYVLDKLRTADRARYDELVAAIDAGIRRDINAERLYWQAFEGPVQTVATATNDVYLKSNRQTDGVQSYGRMVDLVLAFHAVHGDLAVGAEAMDRLVAP